MSGQATSLFINGFNTHSGQKISVEVRAVRSIGAASAWAQVVHHMFPVGWPVIPIHSPSPVFGPRFVFYDSGYDLGSLEPADSGADETSNRLAMISGTALAPGRVGSLNSSLYTNGQNSIIGNIAINCSLSPDTFMVIAQIAPPLSGAFSQINIQVDTNPTAWRPVQGSSGTVMAAITGWLPVRTTL